MFEDFLLISGVGIWLGYCLRWRDLCDSNNISQNFVLKFTDWVRLPRDTIAGNPSFLLLLPSNCISYKKTHLLRNQDFTFSTYFCVSMGLLMHCNLKIMLEK